MFCTWVRLINVNPELERMFKDHVPCFSTEPLETAHSRAAAARAPSHAMKYKQVRLVWHCVGSEMRRAVQLKRAHGCVSPVVAVCCAPTRLTRHATDAPRSVGISGGKTRAYSGRVKLNADSPMVKRAEKALLDLIEECKAEPFTIPVEGTKVLLRDPAIGPFTPAVLLPKYDSGVEDAKSMMQRLKQELRGPFKSWSARAKVDPESGELVDAPPVGEEEEAEHAAGAAMSPGADVTQEAAAVDEGAGSGDSDASSVGTRLD